MSKTRGRDVQLISAAKAALIALVKVGSAGATAQALFGKPGRDGWARDFMRRLVRKGLVLKHPDFVGKSIRGKSIVYLPGEGLQEVARDDMQLSLLLWPSQGSLFDSEDYGEPDEETDEDVEPGPSVRAAGPRYVEAEEHEAEDEPMDEDEPVAPPAAERPGIEAMLADIPKDELLPTILKLCAVAVENGVYARQKLDALIAEVRTLNGTIVQLRKAWE